MGILIKGQWYPDSQYANDKGEFVRKDSQFRNWVTSDGRAGPTGEGGFKAEANRYHLYVSYACPWASRALMMRSLKGLETSISFSVVNPLMLDNGWTFEEGDGVIPDPVIHAKYLYEIYTHVDAKYSGRVTVPVLYDKKQKKIVSNESSDIIRMFNDAFNEVGANAMNYLPEDKLSEIDEWKLFLKRYNPLILSKGKATFKRGYFKLLKTLIFLMPAKIKFLSILQTFKQTPILTLRKQCYKKNPLNKLFKFFIIFQKLIKKSFIYESLVN